MGNFRKGLRSVIAGQLAGGGGGATYYGNLNTPYSGSSFYSVGSTNVVAYKIDFGSSLSGTIDELRAYVEDMSDGSRETNWAVYDHDIGNDEPSTRLGTTGRITPSGVIPEDVTVAASIAISSKSIVWLAIFSEKSSSTTGDPRWYYLSATGGRTITMALSGLEWLTPPETWGSLTNYGSQSVETWNMEARVRIS